MTSSLNGGDDVSPITIHPPQLRDDGEWTRVSYPVEGAEHSELRFDVDAGYRDFVAHSCDAAVASLLAAAMAAGKSIVAKGPLSPRLRWNIQHTVIPVVCRQLPFVHPVRIHSDGGTESTDPTGTAVLTGCSSGVDSLSALADHFLREDIEEGDRITHLLFSHVGHHGYGPNADARAEERWERVRRGAGELGLPILRVHSNTPG
ncbi:MAG: hypothetical protein ACYTFG_22685, partial [Planctomycetota bacterium]